MIEMKDKNTQLITLRKQILRQMPALSTVLPGSNPALRKEAVERVLSDMIEYGGSLLYHSSEDQQRSFDSTCRKFCRFLTATAR